MYSDQMNLTFCLDNVTAEQTKPLSPHKNILSIHNPRHISNVSGIPKPLVSTISNWMSKPRLDAPSIEKVAFLKSLSF